MFFEGSEKKVEVVVNSSQSLLNREESFWHKLVNSCGAQIISSIKSNCCKAFLLSESSLFVWKDRIVLITCGVTTLAHAVEFFIKNLDGSIENIIFERKNEVFPRQQMTTFNEDVDLITRFTPGQSFLFGNLEDHHLLLFHKNSPYVPLDEDVTLEVLMYGIKGRAKKVFEDENLTANQIREFTGVGQIFDGFLIDDYKFEPKGYSLNALKGQFYFTIHVTPQEIGSYVSFETNYKIEGSYSKVVERVIGIFEPSSFDVVVFKTKEPEFVDVKDFGAVCAQHQTLECGYEVFYSQFVQGVETTVGINKQLKSATEITELNV
ncbi:MAG: hypothetical protein KDD50_14345 [Bdellovibrionales bacterium]|nr:hypothetical protein [Bdellovibrionales bacterium]